MWKVAQTAISSPDQSVRLLMLSETPPLSPSAWENLLDPLIQRYAQPPYTLNSTQSIEWPKPYLRTSPPDSDCGLEDYVKIYASQTEPSGHALSRSNYFQNRDEDSDYPRDEPSLLLVSTRYAANTTYSDQISQYGSEHINDIATEKRSYKCPECKEVSSCSRGYKYALAGWLLVILTDEGNTCADTPDHSNVMSQTVDVGVKDSKHPVTNKA